MTDLHPRARAMRNAATPAERAMWNILRTPPLATWHFRRQVAFEGRYIADFASFSARLVIECDGASHDQTFAGDSARSGWFAGQGYRVLRFANQTVLTEREAVWRTLVQVLGVAPPPRSRAASRPPRKGEGG
ncbi:endonuclease domain-containing protein [Polymorphobacter arshaanensis]|nr:DUF559 domain-containing protein [Polymorphobacter arshaanensis]